MIPELKENIIPHLTSPQFDVIKEINQAVPSDKLLQEQHIACAELTALLDNHIQDLVISLKESLETLQRSEKRIPHEIDLLRNDVKLFNEKLIDTVPHVSEIATEAMRNPVLIKLDELNLALKNMDEVIDLLSAVDTNTNTGTGNGADKESQSQSYSRDLAEKLAVVFKDTPDENKYKQKSGYYGLFNKKII